MHFISSPSGSVLTLVFAYEMLLYVCARMRACTTILRWMWCCRLDSVYKCRIFLYTGACETAARQDTVH